MFDCRQITHCHENMRDLEFELLETYCLLTWFGPLELLSLHSIEKGLKERNFL